MSTSMYARLAPGKENNKDYHAVEKVSRWGKVLPAAKCKSNHQLFMSLSSVPLKIPTVGDYHGRSCCPHTLVCNLLIASFMQTR